MNFEKSRAQRRRDDQPRHDLAQRLVSLTGAALARLPLEESAREAVSFAASRTQHGAQRRELRHVATVLRSLDDEAFAVLQAAVDALSKSPGGPGSGGGAPFDEAVELWADELIAEEPGSLERLRDQFPESDITRLRQLVRNCRQTNPHLEPQPKSQSRSASQPPALPPTESQSGLPARSRARLLRYLSELMDTDR